ncbi:hypothetical protein COB52_05240 [Candidatus Kaiserbacteria bacterium]|nr:MAG: hypothetical protein COB52_05240 [Candidatus Kaiserbacteria bacterium]
MSADKIEPLLRENPRRYTTFPIQWPDIWESYKKQFSCFWKAEDIKFGQDLNDWKNNLTEHERHFLKYVLAFFAASDGIVNENIIMNFASEVQATEAQYFYIFQGMMENVHCVQKNTLILTDKGHLRIKDLKDEYVNVWNGEQFSQVCVKKTGDDDHLLKIKLSNGMELECTEKHKWIVQDGDPRKNSTKKVFTKDLKIGDRLVKFETPIVDYNEAEEFPFPYTHGFFCGDDGLYNYGDPCVVLHGEKTKLISHLDISNLIYNPTKQNSITVQFPIQLENKFVVPINYSTCSKLRWLEGYCDADGCIGYGPKGQETIQIVSTNNDFLKQVQLMIQTLGIQTKISSAQNQKTCLLPDGEGGRKEYPCQLSWCLSITTLGIQKLSRIGFSPNRLQILNNVSAKNAIVFVTIEEIIDENKYEETYCFNEPLKHQGVFNGILTGQSEVYSLMLNTYIEDEKERDTLFRAIETIPIIEEKAKWALEWIGSTNNDFTDNKLIQKTIQHLKQHGDKQSLELVKELNYKKPLFAQRLLAFAAIEGVMFSGSFAAIFWLKSRNLMKGLTESNEYIARDEGLHVNFAIQLYNLLENKLTDKEVHLIFKEAADLEKKFICEALPWNLERMNAKLMSQYIEYVTDFHLDNLGHSKIYNVKNPFGFMELISMPTKTNFFEGENTQYKLSSNEEINLDVDF